MSVIREFIQKDPIGYVAAILLSFHVQNPIQQIMYVL